MNPNLKMAIDAIDDAVDRGISTDTEEIAEFRCYLLRWSRRVELLLDHVGTVPSYVESDDLKPEIFNKRRT